MKKLFYFIAMSAQNVLNQRKSSQFISLFIPKHNHINLTDGPTVSIPNIYYQNQNTAKFTAILEHLNVKNATKVLNVNNI
jgi:hypothetical protein